MRILNWQQAAVELINSRLATPFEWGKYDCCLFTADMIEVMTGEDIAKDFRGKYDNEVAAKRLLAEKGGLVAYMDSLYEQVELNYAQRGDAVLVDTDLGPAIGIFWLGGTVWLHSPDGLRGFTGINDRILNVWRV